MNTMTHLTEDQFDEILIGDATPEAEAHLAECDFCTEQLAAFAAPMESFRNVTLAWSERQSAAMPVPTVAAKPAWGRRLGWASAMAATLVIGFAIPTLRRDAQPTAPANTFAIASTGTTGNLQGEESITRDNQMLQEIDRALDSGSVSPATLGLANGPGTQQHSHTKNTI